jgi:putative copper export protein
LDTLLATVHALAWAVYVGGSITMEWVLRYAQRTMPPSQVGVVCKNAGTRYRWFALVSLLVIGASGAAMFLRIDDAELAARAGSPELSLGDSYGRTMLLLTVGWLALAATVAAMAFWLHPAQRKRSRPDMTSEAIAAERLRIGRAIKQMDRALKFELVVSVICIGIAASLRTGGLI